MNSTRSILALILLFFSTAALAQTHSQPVCTAVDPEIQKRIDRVVQGLLPETGLEGRYGAPAKLSDRMAFHQTPGVSIAVIKRVR